jgi:cytochrome c oxidase assembly factor CtaG
MIFRYWDFAPSVIIGTALLAVSYWSLIGPLRRRNKWGPSVSQARQLVFYLGTLCMFVALIGPLDGIGDEQLFSAHMAQHMLLSFVAPPLWVIGTPDWLIRRLVPRQILAWMMNPLTAFLLFNGVMWTWHVPAIFDAALEREWLHILEHLLFMAAGVIGWLPVLKSSLSAGMTPLLGLIYLFPSMLSCTALAALITLSFHPLYPFYGNASLGWGLTPLSDQQLAGALMWLPGDMLYMALIVWAFKRLLDQTAEEGQQANV